MSSRRENAPKRAVRPSARFAVLGYCTLPAESTPAQPAANTAVFWGVARRWPGGTLQSRAPLAIASGVIFASRARPCGLLAQRPRAAGATLDAIERRRRPGPPAGCYQLVRSGSFSIAWRSCSTSADTYTSVCWSCAWPSDFDTE